MGLDTGLAGKTALITGASRGIGKATAVALAAQGCNVVVSSRKQDALDEVAKEIRAAYPGVGVLPKAAHVADEDAARACVEAAGFDNPVLAAESPYDLIFANILKGPLIALAPDLARHLRPGGFAILSGILNDQADDVISVYARSGTNLVHSERIGDWTTLLLQKKA